jgi:hypothetical protein
MSITPEIIAGALRMQNEIDRLRGLTPRQLIDELLKESSDSLAVNEAMDRILPGWEQEEP